MEIFVGFLHALTLMCNTHNIVRKVLSSAEEIKHVFQQQKT